MSFVMQLTTEAFFRKPSQIISRDILQEASLAMYYWATDFKPDLTHGSIMVKWSSHARYFFQNMIRWCQNLLLLNYSYTFERSVAPASLILLDYTLAHTWHDFQVPSVIVLKSSKRKKKRKIYGKTLKKCDCKQL